MGKTRGKSTCPYFFALALHDAGHQPAACAITTLPLKKKSDGHRSPGTGSEITASQKCSITLYQTDLRILDEIRNYLRRYGVRKLSDSEALRLACRTIVFNEKLLTTYETMRVDDGRRKRK